jgi:hypothetical protein
MRLFHIIQRRELSNHSWEASKDVNNYRANISHAFLNNDQLYSLLQTI